MLRVAMLQAGQESELLPAELLSSLLQGLEGLQWMMKSCATELWPCNQHQGAHREIAAKTGINVPRSHREVWAGAVSSIWFPLSYSMCRLLILPWYNWLLWASNLCVLKLHKRAMTILKILWAAERMRMLGKSTPDKEQQLPSAFIPSYPTSELWQLKGRRADCCSHA